MRSDSSIRPVLVAAAGVAFFSVLDAMMKVIASTYPLAQSTGMRYCAVAIVATFFYVFASGEWPNQQAIIRSIPRSVANLLAGACFFLAVSRLPLVDAIALTFLSPLFLAIWAWIFLREPPTKGTFLAMFVGLAGVLLIMRGQSASIDHKFDPVGIGAAIATAALYALSMVMTRGHSSKDSLPTLVLLPSVIGAILAAPSMLWTWEPVSTWHYMIAACIGVFGTAGFICLAWAYSNSHVSRLGLLDYTGLIWAAVIGFFIFHEVPSVWTLAGALLIVAACMPAFAKSGSH